MDYDLPDSVIVDGQTQTLDYTTLLLHKSIDPRTNNTFANTRTLITLGPGFAVPERLSWAEAISRKGDRYKTGTFSSSLNKIINMLFEGYEGITYHYSSRVTIEDKPTDYITTAWVELPDTPIGEVRTTMEIYGSQLEKFFGLRRKDNDQQLLLEVLDERLEGEENLKNEKEYKIILHQEVILVPNFLLSTDYGGNLTEGTPAYINLKNPVGLVDQKHFMYHL